MTNKELTYQSPEGYTIFTSEYLKKKGHCCRSACLHCPFGFTIKKYGLQFRGFKEGDESLLKTILNESQHSSDWTNALPEDIQFIFIKNQLCGVFLKSRIIIKHLILKAQFQQQGISKELVEAYYF